MPEPMSPEFGRPKINLAPPKETAGGAATPKEEQDPRFLNEMMLGGLGMPEYEAPVNKLINNVKRLEGIQIRGRREKAPLNEGSKEELRKEIAESFMEVNHVQLDEMDNLNKFLEDLRNPFPYDSRWNIQTLERMIDSVNQTLRAKGKEKIGVEGRAVLKVLKRDLVWGLSSARIMEAMGPSFQMYYDGELQLSQMRTMHSEIESGDFSKAFKKEIKGLELTSEEKEAAQKTFSKIPPEYLTGMESSTEMGLRERAVEYQDAYNHWELVGVSASQKNLEKGFGPKDDEEGEHYAKIDEVSFQFLNQLLDSRWDRASGEDPKAENITFINSEGEKVKVKNSLLNPFTMARTDEKAFERYYSVMHELVVNNKTISSSLDKIREFKKSGGSEEELDRLIAEEVKTISDLAEERMKSWASNDERSPYDRVADTVIKSMINLDTGLLASGDMGWFWKYEKNYLLKPEEQEKYKDSILLQKETIGGKEYQFIVKRASEFGAPYDDHDAHTVVFWARHVIDYDIRAETRGSLLFPTIKEYRDRWLSEPPYWKPTFKEFASKDTALLKSLGGPILRQVYEEKVAEKEDVGILGKSNILENRMLRKRMVLGVKDPQIQTYGKFDEEVARYIGENAWPFITPFLSNPGKGDSNEYNLSFPVFLPTFIEDINFWRSVRLDTPLEKMAESQGRPEGKHVSIWSNRLNTGNKLSDMQWENMSKYAYNWYRTNLDMMERWFGPYVTAHEFNDVTSREYEKHVLPSGRSEKEAGKRGRLASRGSRWDLGVIRASVLTQNKVLSSINESKIMHLKDLLIDKGVGVEKFELTWIAEWMNQLADMPETVGKVKNYPGTTSQSFLISYLQALRIVKSNIAQRQGQTNDVAISIKAVKNLFS